MWLKQMSIFLKFGHLYFKIFSHNLGKYIWLIEVLFSLVHNLDSLHIELYIYVKSL